MEISKTVRIVRLDGIHTPAPYFSPTFKHTYESHDNTAPDDELIIERLGDADAITTRIPISAHTLSRLPSLKLIAVLAIGTDMIDLAACKEHNVTVCNVPAASNESVAEQAIALYFALRRRVVRMHGLTVQGSKWGVQGTLKAEFGDCPRTCREEIVGIIGGGELGNRVANICRSLGMAAHFAERKNTPPHLVRSSHTPFTTVLAQSTILFITLPLTAETLNLISTPEFNIMQNDVLLINVARGGIVDETALITALKEKKIGGAATDVFVEEPATLENSVLVQATNKWAEEDSELDGRLVLSPHIAWWARSSIKKLRTEVGLNIEAWAAGATRNVVL